MKIIILFLFFFSIFAKEEITFTYNETSQTLTISGNGILKSINKENINKWKTETKEILIQNGITQIGSMGLFTQWNISKVTIPSSIQLINNYTFANCKNLEEIVFEENSQLETINFYAFRKCISLKQIVLPKSIRNIQFEKLFEKCN